MKKQITSDLAPYVEKGISKSKLHARFVSFTPTLYIIKFSIKNNHVSYKILFDESSLWYRIEGFLLAFKDLCDTIDLPDVTFYISLHDGLGSPHIFAKELIDFPLFVMSRASFSDYEEHSILIPDYESLRGNYQVLKNTNVLSYEFPWEHKKQQLIWRGSTAEGVVFPASKSAISAHQMNEHNCHFFSRYQLCKLSTTNPELIDAKYTFLAGLEQKFPRIKRFQGKKISYKKQFEYKYHFLIDGNAASYSCSGWKFFTNSVIFKPMSLWAQWYYGALQPYEHFIPVKEHLKDFMDTLNWAQHHDRECQKIAKNARKFAVNHLTRTADLMYIYFLLTEYAKLLKQ